MTLDADVRNFLDNVAPLYPSPRWQDLDEPGTSDYLRRARQPRPGITGLDLELSKLRVEDVSTDTGIRLRIYGRTDTGTAPLVVYLHGGGWVMGDLDLNDPMCRRLASSGGFVVVSVDYRLAPEHPFPEPLDDCYAALRWAAQNAAGLGADPDRLVVAGTSAGGNLAAALALMARDRDGPSIACQALVYPVLDDTLSTESYQDNATGYFLEREQMRWYWNQYVPDPHDRRSPYAAPARAHELSGLPPAVVVTAEYDPLRDEGAAFADRLRAAGVRTRYRCYPGQIHGFLGLGDAVAAADPATVELGEAIRMALEERMAGP